jgi:hypothetical protein
MGSEFAVKPLLVSRLNSPRYLEESPRYLEEEVATCSRFS